MENREILVANTKTQTRTKITTDASTLGELKAAFIDAGIDFEDMTFTEGISKTQLVDDSSQLPHDVMYKGNKTNNLVILLTNTNKKIKSGAVTGTISRADVYAEIKDCNLQDKIKEAFGKNFTQVSTADLLAFIEPFTDRFNEEEDDEKDESYDSDLDDDYSDGVNKYEDAAEEETRYDIIDNVKSVIGALLYNGIVGGSQIQYLIDRLTNMLKDIENANVSMKAGNVDITGSDVDEMLNSI